MDKSRMPLTASVKHAEPFLSAQDTTREHLCVEITLRESTRTFHWLQGCTLNPLGI